MRARKRATQSRIHPHSLSIAEALSAVIGPWCHTIGQTIRGTIHPLLLETIRPSSPGAPTHLSTVDFSPLLESTHPTNLINIIADYAVPRSQWELRAKRYQRYETSALCAPLSSCSGCPVWIIRRQTCHSWIYHSRKIFRQESEREETIRTIKVKRFIFRHCQI